MEWRGWGGRGVGVELDILLQDSEKTRFMNDILITSDETPERFSSGLRLHSSLKSSSFWQFIRTEVGSGIAGAWLSERQTSFHDCLLVPEKFPHMANWNRSSTSWISAFNSEYSSRSCVTVKSEIANFCINLRFDPINMDNSKHGIKPPKTINSERWTLQQKLESFYQYLLHG